MDSRRSNTTVLETRWSLDERPVCPECAHRCGHAPQPVLRLFARALACLRWRSGLTDSNEPPAWIFCIISGVTQCEAAAPLAGGLSALLWCVKPSFPGFHVGAALELKERVVVGGVYRECLCIKRRESQNNVKFRHHVSLAQVIRLCFLVARHFNFSTPLIH